MRISLFLGPLKETASYLNSQCTVQTRLGTGRADVAASAPKSSADTRLIGVAWELLSRAVILHKQNKNNKPQNHKLTMDFREWQEFVGLDCMLVVKAPLKVQWARIQAAKRPVRRSRGLTFLKSWSYYMANLYCPQKYATFWCEPNIHHPPNPTHPTPLTKPNLT